MSSELIASALKKITKERTRSLSRIIIDIFLQEAIRSILTMTSRTMIILKLPKDPVFVSPIVMLKAFIATLEPGLLMSITTRRGGMMVMLCIQALHLHESAPSTSFIIPLIARQVVKRATLILPVVPKLPS